MQSGDVSHELLCHLGIIRFYRSLRGIQLSLNGGDVGSQTSVSFFIGSNFLLIVQHHFHHIHDSRVDFHHRSQHLIINSRERFIGVSLVHRLLQILNTDSHFLNGIHDNRTVFHVGSLSIDFLYGSLITRTQALYGVIGRSIVGDERINHLHD